MLRSEQYLLDILTTLASTYSNWNPLIQQIVANGIGANNLLQNIRSEAMLTNTKLTGWFDAWNPRVISMQTSLTNLTSYVDIIKGICQSCYESLAGAWKVLGI